MCKNFIDVLVNTFTSFKYKFQTNEGGALRFSLLSTYVEILSCYKAVLANTMETELPYLNKEGSLILIPPSTRIFHSVQHAINVSTSLAKIITSS